MGPFKLLCSLVVAFVVTAPTSASCDELPAHIRDELNANAKWFQSFQAIWRCERKQLTADREALDTIAQRVDPGFWHPVESNYRFSDGRYYLHEEFFSSTLNREDGGFNEPTRQEQEKAFNGKNYYRTNERPFGELPRYLHISSLGRLDTSLTRSEIRISYPRAAGVHVPERQADHGISDCESLILHALKAETAVVRFESTELDQQDCLLISITNQDRESRFYLDPARHYLMLRHEERDASSRLERVTTVQAASIDPKSKRWIPRESVVVHYTLPWPLPHQVLPEPVYEEKIMLESLEWNPTDTQFQLDYTHRGMMIADRRNYPNATANTPIPYFAVSMQQSDLEQIVATVKPEFSNEVVLPNKQWNGWAIAIIVLNLLFVCFWYRSRTIAANTATRSIQTTV